MDTMIRLLIGFVARGLLEVVIDDLQSGNNLFTDGKE